jgi:hypothetical protein
LGKSDRKDVHGLAPKLANWVHDNLFQAHRGAFTYLGQYVAFGNDGYRTDPRARREAELLREWLAPDGFVEDAFGTSGDAEDYTWVIVARNPGGVTLTLTEQLTEAVWNAWSNAFGADVGGSFASAQRGQADQALARSGLLD